MDQYMNAQFDYMDIDGFFGDEDLDFDFKNPFTVSNFLMAFDSTLNFLGRTGWRITKNKATGTWELI